MTRLSPIADRTILTPKCIRQLSTESLSYTTSRVTTSSRLKEVTTFDEHRLLYGLASEDTAAHATARSFARAPELGLKREYRVNRTP